MSDIEDHNKDNKLKLVVRYSFEVSHVLDIGDNNRKNIKTTVSEFNNCFNEENNNKWEKQILFAPLKHNKEIPNSKKSKIKVEVINYYLEEQ